MRRFIPGILPPERVYTIKLQNTMFTPGGLICEVSPVPPIPDFEDRKARQSWMLRRPLLWCFLGDVAEFEQRVYKRYYHLMSMIDSIRYVPSLSTWQHVETQEFYQVILISNGLTTRVDFPPTVTYQDTKTGAVWSRPIDQFIERHRRIA